MPRVNSHPQSVHIVFREVESEHETTFGPERPIVGATFCVEKAARLEQKNPGLGIHWQTFSILESIPGELGDSVVIAVRKGIWGDDVYRDPSPERVFLSVQAAREWLANRQLAEVGYVFLSTPIDNFDLTSRSSSEVFL